MPDPIVVIGAGLAGLNCALHLQAHGQAVRLLDASDRPGGILRTDTLDGFRIDRGFQVLQTAYPEARAALDYDALSLRPFYSGSQLRVGKRMVRISDPWRHPGNALADLSSGVFTPLDALRLWRKRSQLLSMDLETLMQRPAQTIRDQLTQEGFSKRFIAQFFAPLYRGVFLEDGMNTSSRLGDFIFRIFAAGPVALPAEGIEAIPRQLAARLHRGTLVLNTEVDRIDSGRVLLLNGETIAAKATVIATDAQTASRLCPEIQRPEWNSVTTLYFDAPRAPLSGAYLILNADDPGPVSHMAFPTEVSPELSDRKRTLACVSVIGVSDRSDEALRDEVIAQLKRWWGDELESWRLLQCYRLSQALPVQSPSVTDPVTRPVALSDGRFVCGGHRETSSIGGALRSGRRAARAVLDSLPG